MTLLALLVACDPGSFLGTVPATPAPAAPAPAPPQREGRRAGWRGGVDPGEERDPMARKALQDGRTRVVDLTFEGRTRRYRVVPPDRYEPGRAWPVLLGFHGGGPENNGRKMEVNWTAQRGKDLFLVFPDGEDGGWFTIGEGGAGPDDDPLRDVRFARAVVDDLAKAYTVDRDRVYAVGFSNGAMLVWSMLCAAPDGFAGFAMVGSGMTQRALDKCAPPSKRPAIYIHGTGDFLFPGSVLADRDIPVASSKASVERLREVYACEGEPVRQELDGRCDDGKGIQRETSRTCPGGGRVEYLKVQDGRHAWPGGRGPCNDLDGSAEILRWFGLEP